MGGLGQLFIEILNMWLFDNFFIRQILEVMKRRQSLALNLDPLPPPPDRLPEINWLNCCICNTGGNLRSTHASIESLAMQFVAQWKHGILPFDASRLSKSDIVGDDAVSYPNFENIMKPDIAKYLLNCKNSLPDYKLKKKDRECTENEGKVLDQSSPNLGSSSSR